MMAARAGGRSAARVGSSARLLLEDRRHGLGAGLAVEGPGARDHLVEHRAEGEQVRAAVRGLAAHLLGRHVVDGAQHRARRRQPGARAELHRDVGVGRGIGLDRAGQAEVQDLHPAVVGQEDVLGLEVAVDDALVVGGGQAAGDLAAVLGGLARGQRALEQAVAQGLALEQLGHQEGRALLAAEIVDRQDVGVREGGDGLGLALEPGQARGVVGQVAGQDLDRHVALEVGVAGREDLAHAAGADAAGDAVLGELVSGLHGSTPGW